MGEEPGRNRYPNSQMVKLSPGGESDEAKMSEIQGCFFS